MSDPTEPAPTPAAGCFPDTLRRITSVAQALVGAQAWVVYSVDTDGNADRPLWSNEDGQRREAYFSRHRHDDPLAPGKIAEAFSELGCLRDCLGRYVDFPHRDACARYERNFMRPYGLSDALDMLLPADSQGVRVGISLLRDAPLPAYSRSEVQILRDFHCLATQLMEPAPQAGTGDTRASLAARYPGLTARELDVAAAVALGMPNKLVARHTGVSPATVKTHLANIFRKCGIVNRSELARLAA